MTGWESAAAWWLDLIDDDPIYTTDVIPLADWATGERHGLWLDIGCGDGRAMRALDGDWIGCDASQSLLAAGGPDLRAVRSVLPDLAWLTDRSLDGALAVLVLEHIGPLRSLAADLLRVIRPGGTFAAVMNHPAFTAEGAGPIVDVDEGEVLWRWGRYFETHEVPVDGDGSVTFLHRPLGEVLTTVAGTGWALEAMSERGLTHDAVAAFPGYGGQEGVPRLIGVRWRRV